MNKQSEEREKGLKKYHKPTIEDLREEMVQIQEEFEPITKEEE